MRTPYDVAAVRAALPPAPSLTPWEEPSAVETLSDVVLIVAGFLAVIASPVLVMAIVAAIAEAF